jgi:hypothetical protein
MDTQPKTFTFSEGERVVRTYECTRLHRLFASDAIGYLTITNHRVIYHSVAKSTAGESRLLSEMPLDDVAGISTSMSASVNWLLFIVMAAVLYFANTLLFEILPDFLTHWVVALLLLVPFGLTFLFERQILNPQLRAQFLDNLKDVPGSTFLQSKEPGFFTKIFRIAFYIGLDLLAWNIATSPEIFYRTPFISFLILLVVAFAIFLLTFGRHKVFTMQIASRTAKDSGIKIEGMPMLRILGGDQTAAQTLQAGPGSDAEKVIHELGAMITDIRRLGELGIQKWVSG